MRESIYQRIRAVKKYKKKRLRAGKLEVTRCFIKNQQTNTELCSLFCNIQQVSTKYVCKRYLFLHIFVAVLIRINNI